MRKRNKQVYAIIRIDDFYEKETPIETKVTVKEIVLDLETAKAEVARLNQLNNDEQARYYHQATRLILDG